MGQTLEMFKTAAVEWDRRETPRMGASLAFYSLLSLAPLLVLVIWICAMAFEAAQLQEQLLAQFRQMVGIEATLALETVLKSARHPGAGLAANIVGGLTLLLGASGVLLELRTALNHLWDIKPRVSANGLVAIVRERFLSFGMVLGVGFLLLVSLSISAALAVAGKFFDAFPWFPPGLWELLNFTASMAVITGMFALIFRFVPDARLPWKSIFRGAAFTAVLFTAGKTAIGLYLGKAGVGSAYGAAGSLVVLVVWIYYSAQIFYFGAILTHTYACKNQPRELRECHSIETASYKTS